VATARHQVKPFITASTGASSRADAASALLEAPVDAVMNSFN